METEIIITMRVRPGFLRLRSEYNWMKTFQKVHVGKGHTGANSSLLLYQSEIFIPKRKIVTISCKGTIRNVMGGEGRGGGHT